MSDGLGKLLDGLWKLLVGLGLGRCRIAKKDPVSMVAVPQGNFENIMNLSKFVKKNAVFLQLEKSSASHFCHFITIICQGN